MENASHELRSAFSSAIGGVMTEEAGAVTGDLELSTTLGAGILRARVRYAGADEWYGIAGSPMAAPGNAEHRILHEAVRAHLARGTRPATPGANEPPSSLQDLGPL